MTISVLEPVAKHLDEQIDFGYTVYDADDNRQSMAGVADLRMTIYRQSDMAVIVSEDASNCSIDEVGPASAGDVRYSRPPDGVIGRGRYWCKFLFTIDGVKLAAPENQFIPLIVT